MALVVEDGSGLPNANSYNSVIEIRSYADARGYDLPTEDADVDLLAVQATDYVDSFRTDFQGKKTNPSVQALQWPRTGVEIDDEPVDPDSLPRELKNAHAQASIEAYTTDLMANGSAFVKKEKVDVIEVEYSEPVDGSSSSFTKIDSLLGPLLKTGGSFSLVSLRV